MPGTLIPSLHTATPRLLALDPRGSQVRVVDLHRCVPDVPSQQRIQRQRFNLAGRLEAAFDPRLGEVRQAGSFLIPNLANRLSLSGRPVLSESVDAGWRLDLKGEAGETRYSWDGRHQYRETTYDGLLRPIRVVERGEDDIGRVAEYLAYGGPDADCSHNLRGHLVRHDDGAGSYRVGDYCLRGNVLMESRRFLRSLDCPDWPGLPMARDELLEPETATSRWELGALGDTLAQTDAGGNVQRCAYGVSGLLQAISLQVPGEPAQTMVSGLVHDASAQVIVEMLGNGVVVRASYGERTGLLTELHSSLAGQPVLQSLHYRYDACGNVIDIEDRAMPPVFFANQRVDSRSRYGYDSLYQLIDATGFEAVTPASWQRWLSGPRPFDGNPLANYQERYEYDAGGNLRRLVHTGSGNYTRTMAIASGSNRGLPVEGEAVPGEDEIADGFDANGNLKALFNGQTLEWTVRNQLRRVVPIRRVEREDDQEIYVYDASVRRLRKVTTSVTRSTLHTRETRYLPSLEMHTDSVGDEAWQIIDVQAGLSRIRRVRWLHGTPAEGADVVSYALTDHLRSTTLELDQAAQLISQESYYPFGGSAWWHKGPAPGAIHKRLRHAGRELDATGLYYYGQRYYAPWLQRWISPDPAGSVDGLNLYRFVRNSPMTFTDVGGLQSVNLLYGFDPARDLYLQRRSAHSSLVTIDLLNAGVGITPETLNEYYEDVIEGVKEGGEVPEEGLDIFMEKTQGLFQEAPSVAEAMLQSWSDFLEKNQSQFDVTRKLAKHSDAPERISQFWAKNLDEPVSAETLNAATRMLMTEPASLFEHSGAEMKKAAKAVTNWTFRQFSKLGLEWVASGVPDAPAGIDFVDIGLANPALQNEDWRDLAPEQFQNTARYKGAAMAGLTYEPITYSERRHVERRPEIAERVRFIRVAQLRN